jgi:hypothetical protein
VAGRSAGDVGSELLADREVPRLAEMRLQALETRIDADLHLGQHADVITELRAWSAVIRSGNACTPSSCSPSTVTAASRGARRLSARPSGARR